MPSAPGRPEVTEASKSAIATTWAPPEKDGGNKIFNYVLEYRTTRDVRWSQVKAKVSIRCLYDFIKIFI